MSISKMEGDLAPNFIKQTTLNKFCPSIPEPEIHEQKEKSNQFGTHTPDERYSIRLELDGTIEIEETHCYDCHRRLIYNGFNERIAILDKGLGKYEFRLHRKRCPSCGEITPDYSALFPKYGTYHENYKRRARQHYMEGLMPSQIAKVFEVDFGIKIAVSTIINWINEVQEVLREMLATTPIPSSGYWGYDEIHLRISGERMYAIDTIDVNTGFVPVAKISSEMGRDAGREVLMEGRKNLELKIEGIVKDMTTNLGGLFRTRSFKHVSLQNCLTHVKWAVSRHVKAFAGLSTRSKKPIPQEWRWLLSRFYRVIDSKHETDAYIQLEILRSIIPKLKKEKQNHLITAFKTLSASLLKIIECQRDPKMPTTNNKLEGQHKVYTYYPSFKRNMMTPRGAQRVLDYRVFRHNFQKFSDYITNLWRKYKTFRIIIADSPIPCKLAGFGMYFKHRFLKIQKWAESYIHIWNTYFKVK